MKKMRPFTGRFLKTLLTLFVFFATIASLNAQSSGVDGGFNPLLTKQFVNTAVDASGNFLIQPDGKIIAFAGYRQSNSSLNRFFIRYNQDGTIDNTFNCAVCSNYSLGSAILQPDGKIVAAGSFIPAVGSDSRAIVLRLNSDGSLDSSLTSPFSTTPGIYGQSARVWAVQPDGKIFVEWQISGPSALTNKILYRLNSDGSFDTSFQTINAQGLNGVLITNFVLLPDGKYFISGRNYPLVRFNSDGTRDTSFEAPTLTSASSMTPGLVTDFGFQSDGKIIIVGSFESVNGVARKNFARLNPAGNLDLGFVSQLQYDIVSFGGGSLEVTPDDKIIVSSADLLPQKTVKLNADGTIDNTFTAPSNITLLNFKLDGNGKIVFFGKIDNTYRFGRLNSNGSLDIIFTAPATKGIVSALALQADGKIVTSGDFDEINGVNRNRIARLNADGSVDATFNPGSGFNVAPTALAAQSDGKILAGGNFVNYNGTARANLVRINTDGSLDAGFNPTVDQSVRTIVVQSDGKILIGGTFTTVNGNIRNGLARLNADGTLDTAFNVVFSSGTAINSIVLQSDGKIVVGGGFNGVNGFNRTNLVRLNGDGTLDASFNAGAVSPVRALVMQPDGKYVAIFVNSGNNTVRRLNNDGSADGTFQTATITIDFDIPILNTLVRQADGSIVIGGLFTAVNGINRRNIARLLPNGAFELAFVPNGTNGEVKALAVQADGKTLVGGNFTVIDFVERSGLARVNVIPTVAPGGNTYFDFDGDGRADIAVFRPSEGNWYIYLSNSNTVRGVKFGIAADTPVAADYDGDGKTDIAVWRPGTQANFYILQSSNNIVRTEQFGTTGDDPAVSGDWDGDGKADVAVYRNGASAGAQSFFYYRPSSQPGANFATLPWGVSGDRPARGDFNGDGKLDAAVFRPSNGVWYVLNSVNNSFTATQFGVSSDQLVASDYDGDGKTDIAVYRPSNGAWYRLNSSNGAFVGEQFGISEDKPVPADYDGDGKSDLAVFRPSAGNWYLLRSTQGFTAAQFGASSDVPIPNVFVR